MTLAGTPLSVADALTDALARAQLVGGAFGLENRVRAVLAAALEGLAHQREIR